MPIHDWKKVPDGIFHHFHHSWIENLQRVLNDELLSDDYYAMAEQHAAGFGPDVLTLQSSGDDPDGGPAGGGGPLVRTRPRTRITAETEGEFYRRRKSTVVVRHVSGDRVVAMIEVVSPGNKGSGHALRAFVDKACELLEHKVHLLVLDVLPPTRRDPNGVHAAVWEQATEEPYSRPADKPLTLAAYEAGPTTRAYVEPVAVGDELPDMPLFLEPGGHVPVPLERTYMDAWAAVPRRWRRVIEPGAGDA